MRTPIVVLLALLSFSSCSRHDGPVTRQGTVMDTYLSVSVYDDITEPAAAAAIDSVFTEIGRIDAMASDYNDQSEVGRANLAAGRDSMKVSAELADLLRRAIAYGDSTHGAFDITVGPLEQLWNVLSPSPRVPPRDSVDLLRKLVGYRSLSLLGNTLFLPRAGMRIDLGAIGKGYAVDRAAAVLTRLGIRKAIVDLGGNLYVRWEGTKGLDSAVATIAVRHPRSSGSYLGTFACGEGGVSTSGDYERYFMAGGVRYHHILDPSTGYPARGVVSTTIVAPTGEMADALSTIVFVMGRARGLDFLTKVPNTEGFIVYESGDSLAIDFTPGFRGKFSRERAHD